MKKILIVDDEKRTRDLISSIVKSFDYALEINSNASSVEASIELINVFKPDIVLLDIQLPDGNGFDVLKRTEFKNFNVIFITAHEEYAIKAIKFAALDYILKPIDTEELQIAIKKAMDYKITERSNQQFETIQHNANPSTKKRLVLKTMESIYVVDLENIIRCESDRNYTTFYLNAGNKIVVSKTLKDYENMLSCYNFLRVQQSHLINIDYVDRYDKVDGGAVILKDGSQIPLSPTKRDLFFQLLETI